MNEEKKICVNCRGYGKQCSSIEPKGKCENWMPKMGRPFNPTGIKPLVCTMPEGAKITPDVQNIAISSDEESTFVPIMPDAPSGMIFSTAYETILTKITVAFGLGNKKGHLCIVGNAGLGKSEAVNEVCRRTGRLAILISCSGDLKSSSFFGRTEAKKGVMGYQKGLARLAIEKGYVLILDEGNMLEPDITSSLHQLLTDGQITLANSSEVIKAHPEFRMVVTMNPTNYAGTKPLNQAFDERLKTIKVVPDEEILTKLVLVIFDGDKVKTESFLLMVRRINDLIKSRRFSKPISYRILQGIIDLKPYLPLEDCLDMVWLDKINDNEKLAVASIVADCILDIKRIDESRKTEEPKKEERL